MDWLTTDKDDRQSGAAADNLELTKQKIETEIFVCLKNKNTFAFQNMTLCDCVEIRPRFESQNFFNITRIGTNINFC